MKCKASVFLGPTLVSFDIKKRYHFPALANHRKTLLAIFAKPTQASILFADIEALIKALGGSVLEREGSRVRIELNGALWRCHRPHPSKEAKRYQVEEARELLERAGVQP
ncbi:MAG: hypothetical protein RLZZ344_409 [Pseudomonadota bacterium]